MVERKSEFELRQRCKRQVLDYLKIHGSTNADTLQVLIDANNVRDRSRVLADLMKWGYIEVKSDTMIHITKAGLMLLKDTGYWNPS